MVAYTDPQLLPYQTELDRPCDLSGVWCDLTAKVDSKIRSLDLSLNRVSPAVPAAKLSRTTPFTIVAASGSIELPFEVADFDTDNMIDMAKSQFNILPTRTGTYLVTCYVDSQATDTAGFTNENEVSTHFNLASFRSDQQRSPAVGTFRSVHRVISTYQAGLDAFGISELLGPGFGVRVAINVASIIITYAELVAYWINDQEG